MSSAPRFRGFDGLRAIAILLVIAWHGALTSQFPEESLGFLRPVIMTGWAGVDLFFALSGFLITSLILNEERHSQSRTGVANFSLKLFYARRALRILPVFFVVFALNTWVLAGYLPSVFIKGRRFAHSAFGLWPYATFWGNYVGLVAGWFHRRVADPGLAYGVYWSLCVEEHFYLLWPLLLSFVKARRTRVLLALIVCTTLLLLRAWATAYRIEPAPTIHTRSHYRMDSILWGALGALVVNSVDVPARTWRLLIGLGFALVAWLAVTQQMSVLPPGNALGVSVGLTMLAVLTTAVLIDFVRRPESWATRVLEWWPLRTLGKMSYAIYLIHFQAIDLGRLLLFSGPRRATLGNFLLGYALFVALSVMAGAVLHILVEKPFLRLRDRFRAA